MKTYKSSDLTHKRAEVLNAARKETVVIQQLETNGNVRDEFLLCVKAKSDDDNTRIIEGNALILKNQIENDFDRFMIGSPDGKFLSLEGSRDD